MRRPPLVWIGSYSMWKRLALERKSLLSSWSLPHCHTLIAVIHHHCHYHTPAYLKSCHHPNRFIAITTRGTVSPTSITTCIINTSMPPPIYLLSHYSSSTTCVPGHVLGLGETAVKRRDTVPFPGGLQSLVISNIINPFIPEIVTILRGTVEWSTEHRICVRKVPDGIMPPQGT